MSKKPSGQNSNSSKTDRPSRDRRKLLKTLTAGGGAALVGKVAPEQWTKPIVDSVLLPAHAQVTPAPPPPTTLLASVTFDDDTNFDPPVLFSTTTSQTFPLSGAGADDNDFQSISIELDPPLGVPQDANFDLTSTADGASDQTAAIDPATGIATFTGVAFDMNAGDPATDTTTLTFTTAGVAPVVMTFAFS